MFFSLYVLSRETISALGLRCDRRNAADMRKIELGFPIPQMRLEDM
jgi:hypothetical protein